MTANDHQAQEAAIPPMQAAMRPLPAGLSRRILQFVAESPRFALAGRCVFALEMVCVMLPTTALLTFFLAFALTGISPANFFASIPNLIQLALCIVSCIAGWALAIIFLRGGRDGLRDCPAVIWRAAKIGALLALAGAGASAAPRSIFESLNQLRDYLSPFVFGVPLLLPFGHLMLERRLAKPYAPALAKE